MDLHNRDIAEDIDVLESLLGDVIAAQESATAVETVEALRTAAIAYRRGEADSRKPLREAVAALEPGAQDLLARAFSTYFELINLAEERHRVREIREGRQRATLADSVEAAVEDLAARGADADTIESVLGDVLIQPTFTAHPTEARRKTVKAKLRSIANDLETLDERRLTDREAAAVEQELEAKLTSLWQTAQVRRRRPEVTDEALNVQWYLENVLFEVLGEVYEELERQLGDAFEDDIAVPRLFEFRSWAGSDRDGNPYVTPAVTEQTLKRQRETVLLLYRDKLRELSGWLSQDRARVAVGDSVDELLATYSEQLPSAAATAEERYPDEPYRQLLGLLRERLQRVTDIRPGGYEDAGEFVADLETIARSLRNAGAGNIADAHVEPLIWSAEAFTFTLAALDVRDHREQHTFAVGEALKREGIDYSAMDEPERVELLTDAILQDRAVIDLTDTSGLTETAQRVLERFASLADWQEEYGTQAVDTYCISMCEEPSHVLEVLFLAEEAGIVDLPGYAGIDIVPLLETESALSGADRIMGTLFDNEAYSQTLAARDDVQEIMLGYSDSNKENGYLAANWSLHRNQKRLARICDDHNVQLRLFHGRGGSISRGGGPMNHAMLALPQETVTGQIKFTVQGEAIAEKYANAAIAERNLEQMTNAQIRARYRAMQEPAEDVPEEWISAMETAADAAREAYQSLLETEGFVSYYEQATPITVIEDLNLGSRPASRSQDRSIEDLRAIPWVFSWTQTRCIIPGWYSLAAGLGAFIDENENRAPGENENRAPGENENRAPDDSERSGGTYSPDGDIETLQEMYREWPFFRSMLDNTALALARTDMEIATEYAALADGDLRKRIFPRIRAEYEAAVDLVLAITDRDYLVDRAWLRENLRRRNPHVDPLNLLQVRLLEADNLSLAQQRALRLTVKGIAAGMKKTG